MRLLLLSATLCLLIACRTSTASLPAYGTVGEFVLTAHTGAEFRSQSLDGKIWVADFIFTTCTGPCPRMSSQMRQLQAAAAEFARVQLISFTVDPARDTPAALAEYARRYQADPARWIFLTGPRETLHHLKREAFKLGDVDGSLNHSTRFVLIDGRARVRGYYDTSDADSVSKVVADIRTLLAERS